jgi:hypothetical protein
LHPSEGRCSLRRAAPKRVDERVRPGCSLRFE